MTVTQIENTRTATGLANPFNVIGTDTTKAVNAVDVMKEANLLEWNVRLRKMETVDTTIDATGVTSHPSRLAIPGQFAVIRDNPITHEEQVVGTVGSDYTVKQNEELVQHMQDMLEHSGGQITAAADFYGNGKQVFFTMELPMSTKVAGNDVINHNLTVFTSHNGSLSLTHVLTHLRVMCANMRNQALSTALASAKNRHTSGMDKRMSQAAHFLGLAIAEGRAFDEKADAMASQKLEDEKFWEIVNQIWVPSTNPTTMAQALKAKRDVELTEILHGPTNEGIGGTVWGGYNTVTQYLQHPSKGTDEKNSVRSLRAAMLPTSDLAKALRKAENLFLATV